MKNNTQRKMKKTNYSLKFNTFSRTKTYLRFCPNRKIYPT